MVTLRRDTESYVNMSAMSDGIGLTDYDKFLLGKQNHSIFSDEEPKITSSYTSAYEDNFRAEAPASSVPTYDEYMESVLNRTTKTDKVMTKAEYERSLLNSGEAVKKARAVNRTPGRLTKGGKIFVAAYVLVVAVFAFVLIAFNTFAKQSPVDADEYVGVETVEAMEEEDGFFRWFE